MAIMIPETIPGEASQGEKRLFAILRERLSNTFVVWHNPKIMGLEADFIILSPTLGLLVIEVKGYFYKNIKIANRDFFTIERVKNGVVKIEREKAPLEQCRGYFINLLETLKNFPVLCHQKGNYEGKPIFPIGHGVVMSNITRNQAEEDNLIQVLEPPQVAFKDELLSWQEIEERTLVNRFKEMFTTYFPFKTLTQDQISTIKGILYPEFVAKTELATPSSVPDEIELPPNSKILKTLDIQQERLARSIGEGHRLFSGVAGSGKTIILLARAKFLISRNPDSRVLILCYNITLAAYLRSLLHDDSLNLQYKKIEVYHFHNWARRILGRLPNPKQIEANYDEYLGEKLKAQISSLKNEQKWDSILVDEAHTFLPEWLKCCVEALKDPENGSLTIVSDGSQTLYERTKFTWKSIGIKARGRSKKLSQNYRNTQEILSAAWSVIDSISTNSSATNTEGIESAFPVIKPSSALRNGVKPVFQLLSSRKKEITILTEQIEKLIDRGYQTKDIAIVYSYVGKYYQQDFNLLIDSLSQNNINYYWVAKSSESKINYNNKIPGIRIITALSSLGLEFKTVMIPWIQQFDNSYTSNPESIIRLKRQLYVAMTRAQEELYLFGSGNVSILNTLNKDDFFDVVKL
ncbi:DNA helicase [Hyella patelloides LEGE 07179]|uniref:DNA 3'-5' helicase n=1 Tax=Hyella patelloides LEGE 07179 TaxID=945734 RepID=A0A563VVS1_9CYAN|nr:nuclease-related domain-containing DEAD/DEAH box helicase [Hyella patelloides]VEP15559.1 DNA helicase [Hyella patelloides LEGE 07179]